MSDSNESLNDVSACKILNHIINENIDYVGFAADMLCIGFGTKTPVCYDKRIVNKSKFHLHIQCDWTVFENDKQICSYKEMFSVPNEHTGELQSALGELMKNNITKYIPPVEFRGIFLRYKFF